MYRFHKILDNCNLNDESLKIFVKCIFQSMKNLDFGFNCFFDQSTEIALQQKWDLTSFLMIDNDKYQETPTNSNFRLLNLCRISLPNLRFEIADKSHKKAPKIIKQFTKKL